MDHYRNCVVTGRHFRVLDRPAFGGLAGGSSEAREQTDIELGGASGGA